MHKINLIGAGGHARVLVDILEAGNRVVQHIFTNSKEISQLLNYKVTMQPSAEELPCDGLYLVAIGNNRERKQIATSCSILTFTIAIHPQATLSLHAAIKEGTVIMAGATINACADIGKHTILNTNCSIDHDCILENYVHVSPNAALAGNVRVGEGTHIGIGACVVQGIKIGKWATIGAGAVIIRDVPDFAVVIGNPGRIIKYNTI